MESFLEDSKILHNILLYFEKKQITHYKCISGITKFQLVITIPNLN
jgi:hypothetical protein